MLSQLISEFIIYFVLKSVQYLAILFHFFPSSYSLLVSLMLLRVRQIKLLNRVCGHITNAVVLMS